MKIVPTPFVPPYWVMPKRLVPSADSVSEPRGLVPSVTALVKWCTGP